MHTITQKRGARAAGPWAASAPAWREDRRTLLIVDDEEGPRQTLRLIFEDSYNVLLARNGQEALELARRQPVDAAVVDIRMAGMSGIDVLRQLKALDATLEVTMLTAYAALETARQALRLGAADYLTKPFDLETIRGAVARMMERRALNQRTELNLQRLHELEKEADKRHDCGDLSHDQSEIYADVLHDINKPLTVIVGTLSLLNHRLADAARLDDRELEDIRQRIKALSLQADNVIAVIRRYLGFFRRGPQAPTAVSVNQTLLDLRELLRVYPGAQTRNVTFSFLPADAAARADRTDIQQILLNLAVNALHATPESGSVRIAAGSPARLPGADIKADGPARRLIASPEFDSRAPKISITIHDEGPGIAPDLVQKIFDAPVTTKPRGLGTGLGLTIVKKLVLRNHGALALETSPGAGTTIAVFLPAAEAEDKENLDDPGMKVDVPDPDAHLDARN